MKLYYRGEWIEEKKKLNMAQKKKTKRIHRQNGITVHSIEICCYNH